MEQIVRKMKSIQCFLQENDYTYYLRHSYVKAFTFNVPSLTRGNAISVLHKRIAENATSFFIGN